MMVVRTLLSGGEKKLINWNAVIQSKKWTKKGEKMTPIKYTDRKKPAALLHIYAEHVMKTQSYCWFIHGNRINLYFKWTNADQHTDHNQLTQCVEICRYLMLHLMNNVSVFVHTNVCQLSETVKMMTTKRILSK